MRGSPPPCTLAVMKRSDLPDLLPVEGHHRPLWVRVLCVVGAVVFAVLGVVGWLIPVVTGIPFYVVAIVLLAVASDRARRWVNALERKLPHDTRVALRRWLGRSRHLRRVLRLDENPVQGNGRGRDA
jgi:hypothetical protein